METILGLAVGLGLASACGFRVFVPLLAMSLAARSGHLALAAGFQWVAGTPALIALATATIVEIAAYYVPWLDHGLDLLATPVALIAGAFTTAAIAVDLPPLLRFAIALIAGGGAAGLTQGVTVVTRVKSAVATAGLANPLIATLEWVAAVVTSFLAIVIPIAGLVLIAGFLYWSVKRVGRIVFGRAGRRAPPADHRTA